MKRNPLLAALVGLFFLSAVGTVLLATRQFFAVIELQKLQGQSVQVNNTMASAQALANEAIYYAKRNPAITSVLERFRTKLPEENAAPQPSSNSPLLPDIIKE